MKAVCTKHQQAHATTEPCPYCDPGPWTYLGEGEPQFTMIGLPSGKVVDVTALLDEAVIHIKPSGIVKGGCVWRRELSKDEMEALLESYASFD